MKNVINFRPLFFCFVAFLTAILFGPQILSNSLWYVLFFALITLFLCIWAVFKKKYAQVSALLLCFALGFGLFYVQIKPFDQVPIYEGEVVVVGRVVSVTNKTYGQRVLLENVTIGLEQGNNVLLTVYQGNLQVGDQITLNTTLENISMFELGSFNSTAYQNKTFYNAQTSQDGITSIIKTNLTLQESIRKSVFDLFDSLMSSQSATLAYSSIFGDRTVLPADLSQAFSDSGIAHILSVSGMHVAFFILVVDMLLKRFKLSPKFRLVLFAVLLTFYSYLCDFNVTVVRASIMALVLIMSGAFGKQYDGLSSIALAGFIILAISPLSAFHIGFQLSFLCVFIITLFAKPLTKFFTSHHIPSALATPLALTLCVQAGILPMIAKYFGQFSLLSIVTNLVAVPLFELGYILTFVFLIPVAILPFLGFMLTFTSLLFEGVIGIAIWIASANWAMVELIEVSNYTLALFYIALFALSGFVMISFKRKSAIFAILLILSLTFSFFDSLPVTYQNLTIMQISQTEQTLFITPQGTTFLIGSFDMSEQTIAYLKRAKIMKIDYVMSLSQEPDNNFCATFQVRHILEKYQNITTKDFSITAMEINDKTVLIFNTDGHNFLYLDYSLTEWDKGVLEYQLSSVTINGIIGGKKAGYTQNADFLIDNTMLVTSTVTHTKLNNWYLQIKNGILSQIRSLD